MALEWIAVGSNFFNEAVPFYANVETTPDYLANTGREVTTDSFYWSSRLIAALADAHYGSCAFEVERYQLNLLALGHELIAAYDRGYAPSSAQETRAYLADCNRQTAERARAETGALLEKVLYLASDEMKNAFSRADA